MAAQPRLTWATLKVFKVLLHDPAGRHYGLEIGKAAGLPSGSIYPWLADERLGGRGPICRWPPTPSPVSAHWAGGRGRPSRPGGRPT
jgi:hypothetical protein